MPKIVDHDAYREEILSRCFELFAREGYAAVTLRRLARELGVSTGRLYHYFPSKEAIFEQMVRHIATRDIVAAVQDIEVGSTPEDRLMAMLGFVRAHEEELFLFISVLVEYWRQEPDDNAQARVRQTLESYIDAIALHLAGGNEAEARLMFDLCVGMIMRRNIKSFDDDFALHLKLLSNLKLQ